MNRFVRRRTHIMHNAYNKTQYAYRWKYNIDDEQQPVASSRVDEGKETQIEFNYCEYVETHIYK